MLAAGRVVDGPTGRPLRCHVRAFPDPQNAAMWHLAQTTSGIDGEFEMWGESCSQIEVYAAKSGYAATTLKVAAGARDLVIALQPARLLRATVLLDPDVAIDRLDVQLRDGDDTSNWHLARIERGHFRGLFELPDGDDLVLEIAVTQGMPLARHVPMRDWIPAAGLFSANVDLRGMFTNVLVTIRDGAYADGSLYVRAAGSSAPWAAAQLVPRLAIAVPKDTTLDAIVRPSVGACVRVTLSPGENTIEVPPPAVAQIEVTGILTGVARTAIAVQVWRLVRREPLLDELAASGLDSFDPGQVQHWPRTAADLRQMVGEDSWQELGHGPVSFELRHRGSYVAVPYVVANDQRLPMLDAAVAIEITTPGAVVEATIRLDPEKVRAALR